MRRVLTTLYLTLCLAYAGFAQPGIDFTMNTPGGCSPLVVQFTAHVPAFGAGATYNWDLGNGNTSTIANPQAIYTTAGNYTVTLTVVQNGSSHTATHTITVYPAPTVSFTASTTKACSTPVTFTGNTDGGNGSTITSWLWDLGDGSTTTQSGPAISHTYAQPGKETVSLTVTDNNGCTASLTQPNIVENVTALRVAFTASQTILCNVSDPVQFTNQSTGPGTLSYAWDFGDGNGATVQHPSHAYSTKGNYNVKLTATSSEGCSASYNLQTPLNVANYNTDFSFPATGVCTGSVVSFNDNSSPTPTSVRWTVDGNPAWFGDPFRYTFMTAGDHTVQLSNTYGGCTQSMGKTVTVNAVPAATMFSTSIQELCNNYNVTFTDHSTGNVSRAWSYQYNYSNPDFTPVNGATTIFNGYSYGANYTVALQLTNAAGCSTVITEPLYEPPKEAPRISFTDGNPYGGCNQPVTKSLTYTYSGTLQSFHWDFGDGTTSTSASPTHTWSQPGTYNISFSYTDANGCTGQVWVSQQIWISAPFTLDFTAQETTICVGGTVHFNSPSLEASGALFYSWDYGDGTAYVNYYHQYTTPGVYTIKLSATNWGGCTASVTKTAYITVLPAPITYNGNTNTCDGDRGQVTFNYSSSGTTTLTWDFGDGQSAVSNQGATQVQHTYTQTGTYYINLTASNGTCSLQKSDIVYVLTKQTPQLTATSPSVCSNGGLQVSLAVARNPRAVNNGGYYDYATQFFYGDGTPFTGSAVFTNPAQPYANGAFNYTLTGLQPGKSGLYVTLNSFGFKCDDVSNTAPVAIIGATTTPAITVVSSRQCYQQPVVLRDASTTGTGNQIKGGTWDFGDGQTQPLTPGETVSHVYANPGQYAVRLNVLDAYGCTVGIMTAVNVDVYGPKAAFTSYPANVLLGNTVYFSNGTNVYGGSGTVYSWDFGDGSGSTDVNPTHLYTSPGSYTVTLRATGSCTSVSTATIVVKNFNSHFQIAASYVTNGHCPPVLVQLTNTSVGYTSVSWDFGDGTTAGNLNFPSHVYTQPGGYQVTLFIYGSGGLIAQYTDSVFVRQASASLMNKTPAVCINQPVKLQATAKGALDFLFDYGDGSVSSGLDSGVTHLYANSGNYTAQLVVTDTVGCPVGADAGVPVRVNPPPTVTVSPVDPHVCLGSGIPLQATGGSGYSWSPATGLDNPGVSAPLASPVVNTLYTVLVTDDNGCQGQGSINVKVVQHERLSVLPDSTGLCAGESVKLRATGTDVYRWIGDVSGLSSTSDSNPVAQPPQTAHYQVVGSDAYGCFSDTAAITVTVLPLPTVNGGGNVVVLAATPVTLAATGSDDVVKWQWTPGDYLSCSDCAQPVCTPRKPETYTVRVTAGNGCQATDTVQVKLLCVESHVRIPEAFSPNGDGRNDRFAILGIGEVDHILIYDRWGVKVFERGHCYTADADSQWDGNFNGQPSPPGVYVYFVEMSCPSGGTFTRKGTLVLLR